MQDRDTNYYFHTTPAKALACGSLFLVVSAATSAQQHYDNPFPLISITDHSKGDGFVQALGINLEYAPVYDGSDQHGSEFQLGGALQYKKNNHLFFLEGFASDGVELGWRSRLTNNWLVQTGLRHETVLPSSDLEEANIHGVPHRGSAVFGFVEGNYLFGKNERSWIAGRLSAGPSDFGYRAKVSVGHSLGRSSDGSGLDVVAYSTFGDEEQFNQYFGISADESLSSGLSQTNVSGGYRSSGLELAYRQNFFEKMQVSAGVGVEWYSDDIRESALVGDDTEVTAELSVVWRFW